MDVIVGKNRKKKYPGNFGVHYKICQIKSVFRLKKTGDVKSNLRLDKSNFSHRFD